MAEQSVLFPAHHRKVAGLRCNIRTPVNGHFPSMSSLCFPDDTSRRVGWQKNSLPQMRRRSSRFSGNGRRSSARGSFISENGSSNQEGNLSSGRNTNHSGAGKRNFRGHIAADCKSLRPVRILVSTCRSIIWTHPCQHQTLDGATNSKTRHSAWH